MYNTINTKCYLRTTIFNIGGSAVHTEIKQNEKCVAKHQQIFKDKTTENMYLSSGNIWMRGMDHHADNKEENRHIRNKVLQKGLKSTVDKENEKHRHLERFKHHRELAYEFNISQKDELLRPHQTS